MKSSKYWIMGTAIMFAALTACSSTHTRSDESAVAATTDSSSAVAVNTGKNSMEKGAAPDLINPADDTVERRNANHYQSKYNRPIAAAPVAAEPIVQSAPEAITTTPSSADLGASSSGMGL